MACSNCGEEGHDRRTCPQEPREHAVIVRVDRLTYEERIQLADEFKDVKRRVAPEARGTIVEGSQKQLPYKPTKQLKSGKK